VRKTLRSCTKMIPTIPPAVRHISKHILSHLSPSSRPLFVAVQGVQGSGKTYLTSILQKYLSEPPHNLNAVVVSIDDFYLPHSQLLSGKGLLRGRGLPGTHDVDLGISVLRALKDGQPVKIPVFEKSLFRGEGDRLDQDSWRQVEGGKVEVVILEGWCVGFYPISEDELGRRWEGVKENAGYSKDDVLEVNSRLKAYVDLWSFFDVFIQVRKHA
jgi:D-glycerate 3-kinase